MQEKYISDISLIVHAFLYIMFGIISLTMPIDSAKIFHIFSYIALISTSVISFILLIFKHKRDKQRPILIILTLILGIIIYYNPTYYLSLFPLIFGIYLFMLGTFKTAYYIIKLVNNKYNDFVLLFGLVMNFSLSFILVVNPYKNLELFITIFGIYLILNGFNYLHDFLRTNYPNIFKKKSNYFTAKIPIMTFTKPYEEYHKYKKKLDSNVTKISLKGKNIEPDIEVLIHVKSRYPGTFGHSDIVINNKVYSFGNYDDKTKKLWESLGDGVLFETPKEEYISFCTKYSKKMMFCFGLKLNEKQKLLVQNKLDKILSNTYRWYPDYVLDKKNKDKYNDYASTLAKNLDIKFYKFYKTSYKKYFLFYANCVKLVDDILGSSGLDLLKLDGLVVPGTYYDFLDKEFKLENSNVVSKSIYIYKEDK